jgi:predicted Zn-dependent peptidase
MVINLKNPTELSGFYIVFDGATNLEKDGIFGISHLMEHLICKNFEHLRPKFEKYGIHWNAYTTNNEVVFFFTGLDKFLQRWKQELVELVTDFRIKKEDFEKEKKIVLQEYNLNFGDQSKCHLLNLNRKLFKDYHPIGKKSDLVDLKFMDCIDFFEKQFSSPSKIINVSNDNKFEYDFEPNNPTLIKKYEFGPYTDVELEPTRKSNDKVSIIMMSNPISKDFNYVGFINSMMSMGLSSPLYKEIREKQGLVYSIDASQQRMNDKGCIMIRTETSVSNKDRVIDGIKEILSNPSRHLTPQRYELTKNAFKIKYFKDKIDRYQNVGLWINPIEWSVKKILPTMTYDDVMNVYGEHFKIDNFYISDDRTEFI